jgi:hypothetical protein
MKVFLAGCENWYFGELPSLAKHPNVLFSYYHWSHLGDKDKREFERIFSNPNQEVICDSGLFTLMFGAGKGGNYDLPYMIDYTKKYIALAKQFKIPNLTIVESDVHKLLGMEAVFELRKLYEDSGMKVMYVWHREESIEGLYRLAERYDYIAISIPELRIICKGNVRYQDATKDLLNKIVRHVPKLPRIHLLGNTVQETMETNIAYSCDSTSWLSGGRYGRYMHWDGKKLRPVPLDGQTYLRTKHLLEHHYKDEFKWIADKWEHKGGKRMTYIISMYLSARSYSLYQQTLDRRFQCLAQK